MMINIPEQASKGLNEKEQIYFVLAIVFLTLSWLESIQESVPSGKWAWVHRLAVEYLGRNGFAILLAAVSGVCFAVCFYCWIVRVKNLKKEQ